MSPPGQHDTLSARRIAIAAVTAAMAWVALPSAPSPADASRLTDQTGRIEVDAMEYPWSAIGRLNTGGRGHCTGFLVGERTVLTAAHCLYDWRQGRWRGASELYFVAGYQRDTYIIHSPVVSYARASGFVPLNRPTTANAVTDWAFLTLARPIGRQAGWLGLRRLDNKLRTRLRRGEASLLQAGYRQGWANIMSINLNCALAGSFQGTLGIADSCNVAKGDSGSPLLVLVDGTAVAIGLHVLDARAKGGTVAGALSAALFHPGGGATEAIRAARRAGVTWNRGQPPASGGPALPVPSATIGRLLNRKGTAAIADFEARAGLPVTGKPSLAVLSKLIANARPAADGAKPSER